MTARTASRRGERGSATPIVVAALAVIVIVALAVIDAGAVMIAQANTSASADLAALAAARVDRDLRAQGQTTRRALSAGCDEARAVAARNGVVVVGCERGASSSVVVTVEVRVRAWPAPVKATARAGAAWG